MPKILTPTKGGPALVPVTPSVGTTGVPTGAVTESVPRPGDLSTLPFGESALPQPFRKSATSVGALFASDSQRLTS